jgi:glutathione synthase/RimK-type ligase-like ATP-grasp enzyme
VFEPAVLLVGHGHDEHSDRLEQLLTDRGVASVVRLALDSLPSMDFVWTDEAWSMHDHRTFEACKWSGLWRRPGEPAVDEIDESYRDFSASECTDALLGAIACLDVDWLNSPTLLRGAELKLWQLRAVQTTGINVPPTLVTNSSKQAMGFLDLHKKVVIKPVRYGLVAADPLPRVAWTQWATKEMLRALEGIPVILQRYVEPAFHVRIVTVEDDAFPACLRVRELDWRSRLENHDAFAHVPSDMRDFLTRHALQVSAALGVRYTSQDWIVAPDGEATFLEANPNGQWMFLDGLFDGRVSERVAEALEQLAARGSVHV